MSFGKGGQRHLVDGLSIKNSALMRDLCVQLAQNKILKISKPQVMAAISSGRKYMFSISKIHMYFCF